MREREFLVLMAVTALFVMMTVSFVGIPWPSHPSDIPVYNSTSEGGIANTLFGSFPVTVILIALLLGSAMIGGIYLAKMEGGEVGP